MHNAHNVHNTQSPRRSAGSSRLAPVFTVLVAAGLLAVACGPEALTPRSWKTTDGDGPDQPTANNPDAPPRVDADGNPVAAAGAAGPTPEQEAEIVKAWLANASQEDVDAVLQTKGWVARPAPQAREGKIVNVDSIVRSISPTGKSKISSLITGNNAYVGYLKIDAGASIPEHQDATEEYIYVLKGKGTLTLDGQSFEIGPDTLVYMPAGATVSFQNGGKDMRVLQIFAGPEPAKKYDAWTPEK